jgi:hypothetical protein
MACHLSTVIDNFIANVQWITAELGVSQDRSREADSRGTPETAQPAQSPGAQWAHQCS